VDVHNLLKICDIGCCNRDDEREGYEGEEKVRLESRGKGELKWGVEDGPDVTAYMWRWRGCEKERGGELPRTRS
jgi:hypothetical protein